MPAPAAELRPITEFAPGELGTAIRNLAQENLSFLGQRLLTNTVKPWLGLDDTEAGRLMESVQADHEAPDKPSTFAIVDADDHANGLAEIHRQGVVERFVLPPRPLQLAFASKNIADIALRDEVPAGDARIIAWTSREETPLLVPTYAELVIKAKDSVPDKERLTNVCAWTIEPIDSPEAVRDAISQAGIDHSENEGYPPDVDLFIHAGHEGNNTTYPKSRLYQFLDPA